MEMAVFDIEAALRNYVVGGDIDEAQARAEAARTDLQSHLERVRKARIALKGRQLSA
jgi:hypothetical protein